MENSRGSSPESDGALESRPCSNRGHSVTPEDLPVPGLSVCAGSVCLCRVCLSVPGLSVCIGSVFLLYRVCLSVPCLSVCARSVYARFVCLRQVCLSAPGLSAFAVSVCLRQICLSAPGPFCAVTVWYGDRSEQHWPDQWIKLTEQTGWERTSTIVTVDGIGNVIEGNTFDGLHLHISGINVLNCQRANWKRDLTSRSPWAESLVQMGGPQFRQPQKDVNSFSIANFEILCGQRFLVAIQSKVNSKSTSITMPIQIE